MSIKIEIHCAMCGNEASTEVHEARFDSKLRDIIKLAARNLGWEVQQNGTQTDLYCSKRCAS